MCSCHSIYLNSSKDGVASVTHGDAFVAQAARKGLRDVSTKQLNSEELTALRGAKQIAVQNWVRNGRGIDAGGSTHQKSHADASGVDEQIGRALQSAPCR